MKAKDLMVGDYIRAKQGIATVVSVWEKAIYAPVGDNAIFAAVGDEVVELREGEFKEIPLTPWILEKNGFNDDSKGVYGDDNSYFIPTYQSGFDTGTWETHIEPTEGIGDFSGKLRYVHQLQHALRLCGIEKEIEL